MLFYYEFFSYQTKCSIIFKFRFNLLRFSEHRQNKLNPWPKYHVNTFYAVPDRVLITLPIPPMLDPHYLHFFSAFLSPKPHEKGPIKL